MSCSLLLRSAAHGRTRFPARLGERSRGLSCPLTCSSTAEGSFGRVIAPSHVLQHGWGSVLAGYRALTCARARLRDRLGGLLRPLTCSSTAEGAFLWVTIPLRASARLRDRLGGLLRPLTCSSTAGGALGALFVPRREPGVSRCLMRRLTGRWRERRQGGQGVRRSWRRSRKGCPRRRRGWRWRCGRSCRGARPRSKRRGWRRS